MNKKTFCLSFSNRLLYFIFIWYTVCPRSLDPFNIVTYCILLVKTSWTYSIYFNRVPTYRMMNTNLLRQMWAFLNFHATKNNLAGVLWPWLRTKAGFLKYLFKMVAQNTVRTLWVHQVCRFVDGIWLHRKSNPKKNSEKTYFPL